MAEYGGWFNHPAPAGGDDTTYSAEEYAEIQRYLIGYGANDPDRGPVRGLTADDLEIQAEAPVALSVVLTPGVALDYGFWYVNTADVHIPIPANMSGLDRIDLIVVRYIFADGRPRVVRLPGTPAGAPVPPGMTQNAVAWDIPLAEVYVGDGAGSILAADLTDRRCFVNLAEGAFVELTNNEGAEVEAGAVVIYGAAEQSFDTSNVPADPEVVGVLMEHADNGAIAKVCVIGIVPVTCTVAGAVAIGEFLQNSATPGEAEIASGIGTSFAMALSVKAGAVAGQVTALVFPPHPGAGQFILRNNAGDYTTNSNVFVDVDAANLRIVLTTHGNPVEAWFSGVVDIQGTPVIIYFTLEVDGANVGGTAGLCEEVATDVGRVLVGTTGFHLEIPLAAGVHTLDLQWLVSLGTGWLRSSNAEFVSFGAREL